MIAPNSQNKPSFLINLPNNSGKLSTNWIFFYLYIMNIYRKPVWIIYINFQIMSNFDDFLIGIWTPQLSESLKNPFLHLEARHVVPCTPWPWPLLTSSAALSAWPRVHKAIQRHGSRHGWQSTKPAPRWWPQRNNTSQETNQIPIRTYTNFYTFAKNSSFFWG